MTEHGKEREPSYVHSKKIDSIFETQYNKEVKELFKMR